MTVQEHVDNWHNTLGYFRVMVFLDNGVTFDTTDFNLFPERFIDVRDKRVVQKSVDNNGNMYLALEK